jgi:hypothetical protein
MTEADLSNKNLGAGGAIIISAWLTHKDKGALTKFDISKNDIRAAGGKVLAAGLKGNQVVIELNIADNQLGWDANVEDDMSGIIALADIIPGMGAMTSLNLASNCLCGVDEYGGTFDTSGNACSLSHQTYPSSHLIAHV